MDIQKIRERLIRILERIRSIAGEAIKLPYARRYILIAAGLTILFFILTFPYEVIILKQIKKLEQQTRMSIFIENLDFNLIGDSYIDSLEISSPRGSDISLRDVSFDIWMNPITTLIMKRLKGSASVHDFKYLTEESSYTGQLKSEFELSLDGPNGMPGDGVLDLELQNVFIKGLSIKDFKIAPVRFSSIKSRAQMQRNELRISNIQFAGPDLNGSVRGTIELAQFFGNSSLNIVLEIDPSSRLVNEYRVLLGSMNLREGERIRIRIEGTVQNPRIDLPAMKVE
jgi:hypothetical protein